VICILIGTVGGFVLDRAVGTKPLFFLVGFFAGFALGVWYMIFKARQVAQREEE
jgi:F0F1-type ATP synthase assembly protein I